MRILTKEQQAEIIVKKSRFIAIARICRSIDDVKSIVEQTRSLYPDANHVVHAAVVDNQFSFSDDKEPKGTAGRPAFEVLKGSGISCICVLVVRYFGGTLLGTGGLVKAYGDAVKLVLENIETEEYIDKFIFKVSCSYPCYDILKRQLAEIEAETKSEIFDTDVTLTAELPVLKKPQLEAILAARGLKDQIK